MKEVHGRTLDQVIEEVHAVSRDGRWGTPPAAGPCAAWWTFHRRLRGDGLRTRAGDPPRSEARQRDDRGLREVLLLDWGWAGARCPAEVDQRRPALSARSSASRPGPHKRSEAPCTRPEWARWAGPCSICPRSRPRGGSPTWGRRRTSTPWAPSSTRSSPGIRPTGPAGHDPVARPGAGPPATARPGGGRRIARTGAGLVARAGGPLGHLQPGPSPSAPPAARPMPGSSPRRSPTGWRAPAAGSAGSPWSARPTSWGPRIARLPSGPELRQTADRLLEEIPAPGPGAPQASGLGGPGPGGSAPARGRPRRGADGAVPSRGL
jgi:hypothetical protein